MNLIKKTVVFLMLLSVAFFQAAAQGQVTSIRNTVVKPAKESPLNANNGFSISGDNQLIESTQSRDVNEWINVGNNSSPYGSYNYPVDFFWKTSLTQSIYTAAEINHEPCSIEQVVYTYKTLTTNYPSVIDTEHFRIWLANTDRASLSDAAGFWMPVEDFTLVYEGIVVLNSGLNQEMLFDLTQPFVYNGANVCIMVEHVFSENTFENHFNFHASTLAETDLRSRLYFSMDTPFNFTLPTNDPGQSGIPDLHQLADVKLGINTTVAGSLSGTITNPASSPVANAHVTIQGTDLQTYSNAQGQYEFPYVFPGIYTVNYSAFGYVIASMSVDISGSTTKDLILQYLPEATVEGNVLDNDNVPVAGASIQITGYATYNGTSDATGHFAIPGVYYDNNYVVAVSKNGYDTKFISQVVNSATVSMGDILLTDILDSPSKVVAVKNDPDAEISWLSPLDRTVFRRDGDNMVSQFGHNFAGEVAVFGQVWREPARLYQMSWFLNEVDYPHETVNIYVFALNAEGNPTNTILYEQANVPNVDLEWTAFTFPDTITVENGFFIALSHSLRLEIGIDGGTDPKYPFTYGVNWVSENYGSNEFMLMEDLGLGAIPGNLMIRAEGYNLNTGKNLQSPVVSPARSLNTYNISRLKEGQEQSPELWTLLAEDLTEATYTDVNFSTVEAGWYKYAVKAVYSGDNSSIAAFSNRIESQLSTQVTFNITTNTPTNESMGAVIKLINNSGIYVYTQTVESENGVVVFPDVFKGTYYISIKHDNFDEYIASNVNFTTEPTYIMNCELIEILLKPYNLEINLHTDLSAEFKWNHTSDIVEDFESCGDFAIEPIGVVDWKYNDVDKKNTIGIDNFTYLNENEPHSFMIFNPSQTSPPIDLIANPTIAPHSGDKYLAGFGVTHGSNDDYFISPKLNFGMDFNFRFWAKSFDDTPAPNKIMVGFSTTGFEPADFTWITVSPIELPYDRWTKYDYELTADVKYVTIRNVSDGGTILMIDDVEIYATESARELVNYQVYLNGTLMGETTEDTFTFESSDILAGNFNIAGVKAIYSSGESEMATIEFLAIITNTSVEMLQAEMKVYPNPSNGSFTIEVDGDYEVTILNTLGAQVYNKTISQKEKIMVKDLNPGMYIISAKSDQKAAYKKIIVK